jgi:hypothetical protein
MRATLTLDNDVAALLDRARKEQGRSLEEMANELLRRTLRRLGVAAPGSRQPETQDLDEKTDVAQFVVVPDSKGKAQVLSPRLAHPEQMPFFKKEVVFLP